MKHHRNIVELTRLSSWTACRSLQHRCFDIHVDLFVCWFRKIFQCRNNNKKKNFVKFSKPKFVSKRLSVTTLYEFWKWHNCLCVCVSVGAIFAHGSSEPIALTFSIETRRAAVDRNRTDVEEARISWRLTRTLFIAKRFMMKNWVGKYLSM